MMYQISDIVGDTLRVDDTGTRLSFRAKHALLAPDQVRELHKVLGQWLGERPRVRKVPLRDVRYLETFEVFGEKWERGDVTTSFMQRMHVHVVDSRGLVHHLSEDLEVEVVR